MPVQLAPTQYRDRQGDNVRQAGRESALCIGLLAAGLPKTGELHRRKGHDLKVSGRMT